MLVRAECVVLTRHCAGGASWPSSPQPTAFCPLLCCLQVAEFQAELPAQSGGVKAGAGCATLPCIAVSLPYFPEGEFVAVLAMPEGPAGFAEEGGPFCPHAQRALLCSGGWLVGWLVGCWPAGLVLMLCPPCVRHWLPWVCAASSSAWSFAWPSAGGELQLEAAPVSVQACEPPAAPWWQRAGCCLPAGGGEPQQEAASPGLPYCAALAACRTALLEQLAGSGGSMAAGLQWERPGMKTVLSMPK